MLNADQVKLIYNAALRSYLWGDPERARDLVVRAANLMTADPYAARRIATRELALILHSK